MRRLALAALLAGAAPLGFVCAGCGAATSAPPSTMTRTTAPPTTTAPTTTSTSTLSLAVYFLRDGKVAAARITVPETKAVATAALAGLIAGPGAGERAAGLTTAVPATEQTSVGITDGVAELQLSSALSHEAEAQVVYTLTQFPTVQSVSLGGRKLTRADFEDVTPAILVESPAPGETVCTPFRVHGTANTFEATFVLELRAGAQTALRQVVTATSGSGTRGTYDVTIEPRGGLEGDLKLVVYEESAENGQPIHVVELPLRIAC